MNAQRSHGAQAPGAEEVRDLRGRQRSSAASASRAADGPPTRDLGTRAVVTVFSDGARKEKLRQRSWKPPASRVSPRPYVELHAASAFSFLDGATLPEDLVDRAAALGLPAIALLDTNGVYGAPRFHKAAKQAGMKALVGAEVALAHSPLLAGLRRAGVASATQAGEAGPPQAGRVREFQADQGSLTPTLSRRERGAPRVALLVENRAGYRNLCKLLTAAAEGRPKGEARASWDLVAAHAEGLRCLTGGPEGPVGRALASGGIEDAGKALRRLAEIFPGRVHVELQRHGDRAEEHRNQALVALAEKLGLPLVATNGVRYARPEEKDLLDVLACVREGKTVDTAGRLLAASRERHLKDAAAMSRLFADRPDAVSASAELAASLDFTLADLGYRFPRYPVPAGETPSSYLRRVTWDGARARFRPLTARAQAQLSKELAMIEKLDLAGYFLIVRDIVQFCRREKILVQGRGSAANSAVCYALSITAVDPVKMELLFERFLSEERGEWPDIDLDLPSGDERERVIQHVYRTYGAHGAAMTANVITYRDRSAAREVGKALGFSAEEQERLSAQLAGWSFGEIQEPLRELPAELAAAGLDPSETRSRHFLRLWRGIQNLPRHLGQHSGGMVVADGRLDEVVPLEPSSMPGRVVVQWDKDDCADLGIVKVDLLGLGMLAALEEAIPMIREHEGVEIDLAHLPPDDPAVYRMLNEADTVGVFQLESRAQMATLPRHGPRRFYDIVVQVAIIRPGPIVGGMIRPFFDRHRGIAPVEYPHPCLEPILKRTLGVPLFQEQLLRIAMVAAGFTGGEAEELRRAMGFKRSVERMSAIEDRLRKGMEERGIDAEARDRIVKAISSFALYGFPESHAASFALIAYASAFLRAHHPAAFYASLLNAWPMGFYHPATLVKDAQRHATEVLPIDVARSAWKCRWEKRGVRLGLRFVKGLHESTGRRIEAEQARGPFSSLEDFERRTGPRAGELDRLADAGALANFGFTRREAQWQAARVARPAGPLFSELPGAGGSPLPEMRPEEETTADYRATEMTTGPHLVRHIRPRLDAFSVSTTAELRKLPDGGRVRAAGAVIVRQRPGTAKGFVFLTLEDETGMAQAIIRPDLFREQRALIVGSPGLVVEGILQKSDGTLSVRAERFWSLGEFRGVPSHDFH
ncbi:MAG TPA: error-prone DNA polymerase [Thermoanaerobaculia bacterium]|nr:error-prone DNA polymerase [Thermoanaerobaculia bacterium]